MEKEENTLYPEILSITYSHEEFLNKVSNAELFNIEIAEKTCRNVIVLKWNSSNLSMEKIKTFKDKPEEETVKYIYEQIYNLSKNEEDN